MDKQEIRQRVRYMESSLNSIHYSRGDVIRGMMVAALTGENVALLGIPGTAKSMLARDFARGIGVLNGTNAGYFETCMNKFSTPEQLFGPFKLSALQRDKFERNGASMLQEAKVAFLDEGFKSNASCLNAMLPTLNERIYHENGQSHAVPLQLAIIASNELPTDAGLAAFWDRIMLRFEVKALDSDTRFKLLERVADTDTEETMPVCLKLEEWQQARADVEQVRVDRELLDSLNAVVDKLGEIDIRHGDRRWVKCVSILKAVAYLEGEDEADEDSLEFLQHCLWEEPDEREKIAEVLLASASPIVAEARRISNSAMEFRERSRDSKSSDEIYKGMTQLRLAAAKVRKAAENLADAEGRAAKKIDAVVHQLRAAYDDDNNRIKQLTALPDFEGE